jgi:hypothetical protein
LKTYRGWQYSLMVQHVQGLIPSQVEEAEEEGTQGEGMEEDEGKEEEEGDVGRGERLE